MSDPMNSGVLRIIFFIFVFTFSVFPLPFQEVDYSMAEKGIEWLELVKKSDDRSGQLNFFKNNISITSGADSINRYWGSISKGNVPDIHSYFYHLLKKKQPGKNWKFNVLTKEWYRRSRSLLLKVYRKPALYKKLLEKLKARQIGEKAMSLAGKYLPNVNLDDTKIEFIIFGHSLGFSVENRCVYDFLQLPYDKKGNIYFDEVVQTLAHEIHHQGFKRISKKAMRGIVNTEKLALIWMLATEGIPTFYIDKPYRMLNVFKKRPDVLYRRIASDWTMHQKNLNTLYSEAEHDIALGLNGELSLSAVSWKWNEGVKGAVYVLGNDMVSVIDRYLGRGAAKELMNDYRKMIELYNKAARSGNREGMNLYVFSDEIAEKVARFIE